MNGQTDFTVKSRARRIQEYTLSGHGVEPRNLAGWTFAPRLGDKISVHAIPAGHKAATLTLSAACKPSFKARARAACGRCAAMKAGYDGFWLHRVLVNHSRANGLVVAQVPIEERTVALVL